MATIPASPARTSKNLYLFVVAGIVLGIVLGIAMPDTAQKMKPLGDGFIKLIKMLIAPIIFTTVVTGIAGIGDIKKLGKVGIKALIYFEVVTTFALLIGLVVAEFLQPGANMNINPDTLDTGSITQYTQAAKEQSTVDFLLHIIPNTFFSAFAEGEMLQVLFISILFGVALAGLGDYGKVTVDAIHRVSPILFGIVNMIMKLAPVGAFGAMAYTVGKFGLGSLLSLGLLMLGVYVTCACFIFIVLGLIMQYMGFNLFKFLRYIGGEILLVVSTSSSEVALPRMMKKLEKLGCSKSVVSLVVPAGYSFNLDGTSIYLTMAALFVAQATNTPLSWGDKFVLLGLLMLTSKGAAAVTGGGFITLAATLSSHKVVPVSGITLLLGVDRFMSEARAVTNLIGNGVATLFVANWEKELDKDLCRNELNNPKPEE